MAETGWVAERERVLASLKSHEAELKGFGIATLSLFGSSARGEAGPDSDVDILVRASPDARLGLGFLELVEELGDELGRPVNFAFPDTMQPWLLRRIEAEAINVF